MRIKIIQLFLVVVPCRRVLALPVSSTVSASRTYVPLIVVSVSLFFLAVVFLAVKLVYMKHRRTGTIHTVEPAASSICSKHPGTHHRGFLVGCLGSPAWETHLTSKLDGAWRRKQRRRSSFAYQLHTHAASTRSKSRHSSAGSRLTKSTAFASYSSYADHPLLPLSSVSSRVAPRQGTGSSRTLVSVQRHASINGYPRYGDFGEFNGMRSVAGGIPNAARRASPSSIRLVDGPSDSNQVEYAFLCALPPDAIMRSPLTGTRDSLQLSRCSLKCHRGPVPPLPSLPSFLPFCLPRGDDGEASRPLQHREHLPALHFSPLASVAKMFHSQHHVLEEKAPGDRALHPDARSSPKVHGADKARSLSPFLVQEAPMVHPFRKPNTKSNHKRSQSYKSLAIGASGPLVTNEVVALPEKMDPGALCNGGIISKKPLKSCLRQRPPLVGSPDTMSTPSISEVSIGTRQSTGDRVSVHTPITDDDIGMLGLDRFQWNEEIKELRVRSSHMKKDSIALVPLWE